MGARISIGVIAAALALGACAFAAPVLLISHNTVISVQEDGAAIVIEHIEAGAAAPLLEWSVRTTYPAPLGIRVPRVVTVTEVADELGTPLEYSLRHYRDRVVASVVLPPTGQAKISYIVQNAVRFLRDRDELFWIAGEGWRGPVHTSEISIQVPAAAAGQASLQAALRGPSGFLRLSDAAVDRPSLRIRSPRPLRDAELLSADLVLPQGILRKPALGTQLRWFLGANPIVLLPAIVLALMVGLRVLRSRPTLAIAPQYGPPARLTPAEAGVLIDDRLDSRDIASTLVDLAVRGYVRIEECKPDEGVDFHGQDFAVRLLKPMDEWAHAAPHERILLFHTFYGGRWTKLSSLHLRFYSVVPMFRDAVVGGLRQKRMYRFDPRRAQVYRLAAVAALALVLTVLQAVGWLAISDSLLLSTAAVGASAGIVYLLGLNLTAKTFRGMKAYAALRGFEQFLDTVEADRLERLPATTFESFLPYAMALGVEHRWVHAFAPMAKQPPAWFESTSGWFDPEIFNPGRWPTTEPKPRGMPAHKQSATAAGS